MPPAIEYDPFDITDLLTVQPLPDERSSTWSGFQLRTGLESTHFYLPQTEHKELPLLQLGTLHVPEDAVSPESLDQSSLSAYDTAEDNNSDHEGVDVSITTDQDDVWILPDVRDSVRTNKLTSWDHFLNEHHKEPSSSYLAEAGARAFDAVLAIENPEDPPKVAPGDAYLEALIELAVGRSSQYMRWDDQYQEFVPTASRLTMSGYSPELVEEYRDSIAAMGRSMRILSRATSKHCATPSYLAFRAILETILAVIQQYMERQRATITSLLQLQDAVVEPKQLLRGVEQLDRLVSQDNGAFATLAALLEAVETMSIRTSRCRYVWNTILAAVAGPMLSQLASDLGLQLPKLGDAITGDKMGEPVWQAICSPDLAALITETRTSLRLLRENSVLTMEELRAGKQPPPMLTLHFDWQALESAHALAEQYETTARNSSFSRTTDDDSAALPDVTTNTLTSIPDPMAFQDFDFDRISPVLLQADELIDERILACFSPEVQQQADYPIPFDQVWALSLRPIVAAQHRLLSFSALQILFQQCQVRTHFDLLRQFQLFGNGLFTARVSVALFDSQQSSGEGRRRDGNVTGLRLQNRDAWPPASSELRLVLMGILSEHMPKHVGPELEDAISFSLRDLPEAELEACRDVDSIYALDFLRMQYRPPNTLLQTIISQDGLEKYDRIFRHTLRILRLKSVAQMLLREVSCRNASKVTPQEHRFRIETQHFISTLADYSHNIAIGSLWGSFDRALAELERKISHDDYEGALKLGRSLEHIKQLHEQTLDTILRALLLKEKQSKARRYIEQLFDTILRFAASLRRKDAGADDRHDTAETTRRHYEDFETYRSGLREALRGEEGVLEHLLLRLDWRG
ncbi:uncharacterized protein HMPREF1541_08958 [Cyphellophora europaea CBS 101466]|uniref:Spindle pole body component n=1 Tax=Cyphellophora europaea (strain CBS 101466) TaxID=1220924 RepID=W2RK08_CYPE1|nr:uncharacterized protein HMPREF1541_08958 [Cyphellophora europaea CBS 101466]ETN36680.1 hypothetical protein HMPREF1541_08958 [Cyphellophora europaea CBS 101466]